MLEVLTCTHNLRRCQIRTYGQGECGPTISVPGEDKWQYCLLVASDIARRKPVRQAHAPSATAQKK